jgi:hypothetical protein
MNAIRIRQRLDSEVAELLPQLAPMVGKDVEIIVLEDSDAPRRASFAGPKAGSAKGEVTLAPDFDAPLDDFAEYT